MSSAFVFPVSGSAFPVRPFCLGSACSGALRGTATRPWQPKRARPSSLRMSQPGDGPPPPEGLPSDGDGNGDPLDAISNRDWREFRAALVVGSTEALEKNKESAYRTGHWAHPLSIPETGCFLASHPAYYRRAAPYLTQAVVFITKYQPGVGATGLVLNRPLNGTVAELETAGVFGRSSRFASTVIGPQPVYAGGPDLIESGLMTVLYSNPTLEVGGAPEPLGGVFVSDEEKFVPALGGSAPEAAKARFFTGCLRWGAAELEKEVDEGSWYCISASPLFALKHCIQLPKPLWVEIMQSQGKPFAKIASQVYDEEIDPETEEK